MAPLIILNFSSSNNTWSCSATICTATWSSRCVHCCKQSPPSRLLSTLFFIDWLALHLKFGSVHISQLIGWNFSVPCRPITNLMLCVVFSKCAYLILKKILKSSISESVKNEIKFKIRILTL